MSIETDISRIADSLEELVKLAKNPKTAPKEEPEQEEPEEKSKPTGKGQRRRGAATGKSKSKTEPTDDGEAPSVEDLRSRCAELAKKHTSKKVRSLISAHGGDSVSDLDDDARLALSKDLDKLDGGEDDEPF